MNNKCNNCAKFLTCNRKKCEKITFVEAGIIDKPKVVKRIGGKLMLSKKEIENDNTYKISVPLIDSTELNNIDNYHEEIADRFLKSFVKEKELVIAQHLMQKQQDKIQQLETREQKLIEKLEADKKKNNEFEFMPLQIEQAYNNYYKLGKIDEIDEILKILKGEKDEN